jgi:hypothetical protein
MDQSRLTRCSAGLTARTGLIDDVFKTACSLRVSNDLEIIRPFNAEPKVAERTNADAYVLVHLMCEVRVWYHPRVIFIF